MDRSIDKLIGINVKIHDTENTDRQDIKKYEGRIGKIIMAIPSIYIVKISEKDLCVCSPQFCQIAVKQNSKMSILDKRQILKIHVNNISSCVKLSRLSAFLNLI